MPRPAHAWLGLCLRSESDLPHEWLALAWVVRNRVESGRFPSTYPGVILQRYQFSYFNRFTSSAMTPDEIYRAAKDGYPGDSQGWPDNNLDSAEACAMELLDTPRWRSPFSPRVLHFWAPGAMGGRTPEWADALHVFQLPGLPRWRFGESP